MALLCKDHFYWSPYVFQGFILEPQAHFLSLSSAKSEPPITTAIKREKNLCRITFNPNIVQQAKIATNGVLGDFVIRYDVQRDLGIGDIQVRQQESADKHRPPLRPNNLSSFVSRPSYFTRRTIFMLELCYSCIVARL